MSCKIQNRIETWERRAEEKARYGDHVTAAAFRQCAAELRADIEELGQTRVKYSEADRITGYSLGRLQNRKDIENVGTLAEGAFRLIDLPFKAGRAVPTKILLAHRALQEQREQMAWKRWSTSARKRRVQARARREG